MPRHARECMTQLSSSMRFVLIIDFGFHAWCIVLFINKRRVKLRAGNRFLRVSHVRVMGGDGALELSVCAGASLMAGFNGTHKSPWLELESCACQFTDCRLISSFIVTNSNPTSFTNCASEYRFLILNDHNSKVPLIFHFIASNSTY